MRHFTNVSCGLDLSAADAIISGEAISGASAAALASAARIARDQGARLHLICALDLDIASEVMVRFAQAAGKSTVVEHAKARLEALAAPTRDAGVVTTTEVSLKSPADALVADAAAEGRDLVVVGTRERGTVARNLLGSTALSLLRRCPAAVWVARTPIAVRPVVLASIDLGDFATRIIEAAAVVADRTDGTLHVLHVVNFAAEDVLRIGAADLEFVSEYRRMKRQRAELEVPGIVDAALPADLRKRLGTKIHMPDGDIDATILKTVIDMSADVVVVGSVVKSSPIASFFGLGRTAEKVLPQVDASLLVLKPTQS
ncbi:MAG: universal stress protein [Planctomycetes bacterium]|nr:universal stress protein [Planctomycetota bacterium]